ncbi:MAG: ABC transporter substrate-binding protein, partial [Anaerolineales bacterium]
VNVWSLFDAKGYSYNNYAVMSGYWPRLYQLSIPDRNFETMAASGMPSPFQQEGNFYTATVPLRTDLKWTDGTPFTADDVAFTINTALSFQLGFDWDDFYNPDFIDHADAVDSYTVKFYFKQQPNVGVWQYGALQGPIVQKAYWSSKVSASAELLPPADLAPQIAALTAQVAAIQSKINELNSNLMLLSNNSIGYSQTIADIKSQTDNLNQTNTSLAKAQTQYDSAMDAARQSLYALDNTNEPTLGDWMPAGQVNGEWINKVNPAHPFNTPKFNSAVYKTYASEDDVVNAFQYSDVDEILETDGLSSNVIVKFGLSIPMMTSQSYTVSFLIFNLSNPIFIDSPFRQALACIMDTKTMIGKSSYINTLDSFIISGEKTWNALNIITPCNDLDLNSRILKAKQILETAGYTWQTLPAPQPGPKTYWNGLTMPNGNPLPTITLLTSPESFGMLNWLTFEQSTGELGIPFQAGGSSNGVNYAVFSSHQFDMALLGYNVSEYPGYLCDWFKDGNPFGYQSDRLQSACEALNSTSDLSTAQKDVYEIQSILAQDLPFIPLYSSITYDAYRNIKYPFDSVLGGLSGVYGAPSLAIPAP